MCCEDPLGHLGKETIGQSSSEENVMRPLSPERKENVVAAYHHLETKQ